MAVLKTTKKHFEIFKSACLKYFKEWQLDDWDVYFEHVDLKDSRAHINITHNARMVEISLSTTWDDSLVDKKSLEAVAKHEVLHALLGPITTLTRSRCVTSDEIVHGEHMVLMKLMKLLPDYEDAS